MSRFSPSNLALSLVLAATAACIANANATPAVESTPRASAVSTDPLPIEGIDPGEVLLDCTCSSSGVCPAGEIANKDTSCENAASCPGMCHFNYCKDANGRKTREVDVSRDCVPV